MKKNEASRVELPPELLVFLNKCRTAFNEIPNKGFYYEGKRLDTYALASELGSILRALENAEPKKEVKYYTYNVTHFHRHGATPYRMKCTKRIDCNKVSPQLIADIVKLFDIEFEPERMESIELELIREKETKTLTV